VAIAEQSPKWRDLRRDSRCLLHCLPGDRDDEVVLRCQAQEAPEARGIARQVARRQIHDDDDIIEFDLTQLEVGWWEHVGQPGTVLDPDALGAGARCYSASWAESQ
jgi:hypothetical protein